MWEEVDEAIGAGQRRPIEELIAIAVDAAALGAHTPGEREPLVEAEDLLAQIRRLVADQRLRHVERRRALIDVADVREQAARDDAVLVERAILVLETCRARQRREPADEAYVVRRERVDHVQLAVVLTAQRFGLDRGAGEAIIRLELQVVRRVRLAVGIEAIEAADRAERQ